ncbi:VOC family protein [Nitrogeniibacter aestuarii]|uniref:VOC family protein n=1 Tax=Nitrogeniibacter aestuarii TaxID=2815343 RepID=UPI001D0FF5EA|nr:VOC family protein [Nitrogeniibacter aestuarii]
MHVTPYVMYAGCCEDAMTYYEQHLGAKITALMRYADAPDTPQADQGQCPVSDPQQIMHGAFMLGETLIMASDAPDHTAGAPGVWLSLTADDEIQAANCFDALGEGGQIIMPLAPTFFAEQFGMCTDRFGASWMVIVPRECEAGV